MQKHAMLFCGLTHSFCLSRAAMSCAEASENARHGTDDAAPVLGLTDDKHGSLPTAHLKPIHGWSLWLTLTWFAATVRIVCCSVSWLRG
ncbi:hypothetical protein VFPPC_18402 [Pochonia chlamydosporia 170]|uniref:Secreted protein n=1 Tax=Pochonia chlamydosporia 170 TaxID=1380566 RepID=A0A219AP02_METCM|nr:hypothetical protein VFPPC_18402 [Pochonia chlamydosporia 170]OWT42483.1 hypothetical protein VFPPC_18402 [Pochonia chlamydosporia 170]